MRLNTFAVCLALTTAFLAVFSQKSDAADSDNNTVVKIGVCLSISGEFQESGRKALAGVKLRIDDHNDNRKPGQPKIVLSVLDDKSNPQTAQENAQSFADAKFPVIIGPLATMLVMGMREVAQKEEIVIVSPTVTSSKVGKNRDWVCRLLFDDEFQGTALARFLAERKDIRRAGAVINDRLGYSSNVFRAFKEEFEKHGGEIVAEEHYEWVADELKSYDFTDILRSLDAAEPEIILLPVNSTEVAAIIGQSTRLGFDMTFCGGDTWLNELVRVASGNNVEGAYYVSGINYDSGTPEMEHYKYLYDHSHDPDIQISSVMGYDAASLVIEAMKNGVDAGSIRDGLYSIKNFSLATGTITIDPERGSEKTAFISRIERDEGEFVSRVVDEIVP